MIQVFRKSTPRIILKLFQRRLMDNTQHITQEEFRSMADELEYEMKILEARIDTLNRKIELVRKMIKKEPFI